LPNLAATDAKEVGRDLSVWDALTEIRLGINNLYIQNNGERKFLNFHSLTAAFNQYQNTGNDE